MADTKISALAAYSTQHGDDLFAVVDVHDTSMAASGTDKKATAYQVFGSPGTSGGLVYWSGTSTGVPAGAANLTVGSSGQLNFAAIAAPGSPVNGDTWHDSTQHCLAYRQGGLTTYGPGLIYSQAAAVTLSQPATAGVSLVSTTGAVGTVSLPAGFLNIAGRSLRVRASGYYTTGSTSGNASIGIKLGGNFIATSLTRSATASRTNGNWYLEATIVVATTGSSGTINTGGLMIADGSSGGSTMFSLTNGTTLGTLAPATPPTVDLTSALTFDLLVASNSTGNSFSLVSLMIEVLG
jgi:hypothetical protein